LLNLAPKSLKNLSQKSPKKPIFYLFLLDFQKTLIKQHISRSFDCSKLQASFKEI